VEGNVTIPSADGTPLVQDGVVQGWGAVPFLASVRCWCTNAQGTYALPEEDCAPNACPFPARCVDAAWARDNRSPFAKLNGTKCIDGAEVRSSGGCCTVSALRLHPGRARARRARG
jgi:hypothetical protein